MRANTRATNTILLYKCTELKIMRKIARGYRKGYITYCIINNLTRKFRV